MKKFFIILIIVLFTLGAGYFAYQKWWGGDGNSEWDFVPENASLVVKAKLMDDLKLIKNSNIWKSLKNTSGISSLEGKLNFLDTINGENGFSTLFENTPILISLHKTSKTDFDFLFILEIQNLSQNAFTGGILGKLRKLGYKFKTRKYKGFKISDVSKNGQTFSFIFHKNYLLASFTPYLVEDAVRSASQKKQVDLEDIFLDASLRRNSTNQLPFYINYKQFSGLMSGFITKKARFPLKNGIYETKIDSTYIGFTGFSYANEGWITAHSSQPSSFEMAEITPENTALLYHITSSNLKEWHQKQAHFFQREEPDIITFSDFLNTKYNIKADEVLDLLDNEVGLAFLESPRSNESKKLLLMETKDVQRALGYFKKISEQVNKSNGTPEYTEAYSENEIRFFPVSEFPSMLFGEKAKGFEQCFYINYRDFLIFSNDLPELKRLITTILSEETWGKSLTTNKFLKKTNQSANLSVFINVPRAWSLLQKNIAPEWDTHIKSNGSAYKSIEYAAFQFSHVDGKYYSNFTFSQPQEISESLKKRSNEGIIFEEKLITKPFLVRSHAHRFFDVIVQDSSFTMHFMDRFGNQLWEQNLEEPIQGNVFSIDYYKNGKIQYAFASSSHIHVMDRNGEYISGYPKSLPKNEKISYFNVIDYDLSKNYRFGITDEKGNVFLTNKEAEVLAGWSPLKFSREAIAPLRHERIGRKDVMISIQKNGTINLMARKGTRMSGFPFSINKNISPNYFFKPSNTLANSSITVISEDGELIEVSLTGKIINKNQLIKTSQDTFFEIIPDRQERNFVIVRKENNTYDILDDSGNLMFTKDKLSETGVITQYYQFGAGKNLILFNDTKVNSLYVYDLSGRGIAPNGNLKSANEVGVTYSSNRQLTIYATASEMFDSYHLSY